MRDDTAQLRRELEEITGKIRSLVETLDDEQLHRRPTPHSWSVAECVEHLSVTADKYVKRARRAIDVGPPPAAGRVGKRSLIARMFIGLLEPPSKIRMPAPPPLAPQAALPRVELLAHFDSSHGALLGIIDETDTIDRTRLKVMSPASKYVKFSVYDMFPILAAHARRHLWQAERAARV